MEHAIKTVLRNLWKKKFLTAARILGLIVGYGVFIFLAEKVQHETSYDQFWNDSESVYRTALDIKYEDGEELTSAKNFSGATELLDEEMAEVLTHCNIGKDIVTVFNGPEQKIQDVDFVWSDPTFFEIFERKIIAAQTPTLLQNIHGVVISESFAKKLFGDENPLGKEVSVNEGWKYVIDAVFEDIPSNSHLKIDMVGTFKTLFYYMRNFDNTRQVLVENANFKYEKPTPYMQNRWRAPVQYRSYGYIKLKKGASINSVVSKVDASLKKVALPQNLKDADMNFLFQPIADIHLKSKLKHEVSVNGSQTQVLFLSIIILVVLLVCLVNFINLNTISTIENAKNHSIRILNGSQYNQVFQLLLVESIVLNSIAISFAGFIANTLVVSQLPVEGVSLRTLSLIGAIGVITIFIAAFVPFVSVIKKKTFSIVKVGNNKLNQKWRSQKILVTFQFSITIILIIATVGIYKQMQFMMDKELGFDCHQTLFSYTPMTMNQHPDIPNRLTTLQNEVLTLAGVTSFSVSSSIPGKPINRLNNQVRELVGERPFATTFNEISIDNGYLETYNIPLIAGENLVNEGDWTSSDILINRSSLSKMGIFNANAALGKRIVMRNQNYRIRGVVEDYHHVSLHTPVSPTIYTQNLNWDHSVGYYSFQLNSNSIASTTNEIAKIWDRLYPKEEFIFNFSNAQFETQYKQDQKFNQILSYSALLALLISCLGLLGVALFNTKKRVKEIGIRKVNGATIGQILKLLNKDFITWVVLAFVLAVPASWYAITKWQEGFAYKTTVSWEVYALAGIIALGIALLTISWQSYKAAIANPVKALRDE